MHIHISTSQPESIFASKLATQLSAWGYSNVPLANATIVVGILTPDNLSHTPTVQTWEHALSTGKRLVLLWANDIDESQLSARLLRLQRIDMRHDDVAGWEHLEAILASQGKIIPETVEATQTGNTVSTQHNTNRARMLEKVKVFWIDGVLEQSVHGVALIELGIAQDDAQVENPWETVLRHEAYGDYQLPTSANIADIYRELGNEMLILGNPGSGKTTTLLTLAQGLLEQAESDSTQPIPVIFNLSSWADTRKSLAGWLVDELTSKYQVPRPTAKQWVKANALSLLLDGLDEVDSRFRDECVQAINAFQVAHPSVPMVVCSRTMDYEALSNRLRLNGAIVLQPLDDAQVDRYLASLGGKMQGVRSAMAQDTSLRRLADSPLMLSIMTLAFYDLPADDLPVLDNIDAQRDRLFETYTKRMFERRPAETAGMKQGELLHYLRWLAGRMVERKQSVFYIENLQSDWVDGDWSRALYSILGRLAFGALGGFFIGVICLLSILLGLGLTGELNTVDFIDNTRNLVSGVVATLVITTGLGALVFAIAGVLSLAVDLMPTTFKPLGNYSKRFLATTLVGATLGLLGGVLLYSGVLVVNWIQDYSEFHRFYYNDTTYYHATAYALWLAGFSLWGIGFGAFGGAVSAIVGTAQNMLTSTREEDADYSDVLSLYNTPTPSTRDWRDMLPQSVGIVSLSVMTGFLTVIMILMAVAIFLQDLTLLTDPFTHHFDETIESSITIFCGSVLTALFLIMMTLASRKYRWLNIYVIAGAGIPFFIASMIGIYDLVESMGNSYGYRPYVIIDMWFWSWSLVAIASGGFIGGLIGRITDDIVSAEALRWSWSWRWTAVGVGATIVFSLFFLSDDLRRLQDWTIEWEQTAQERIERNEAVINNNSAELILLRAEYEQLTTQYTQAGFENAVHDYFLADFHLMERYPSYWELPACTYNHTVSTYSRYHPQFTQYGNWENYQEFWTAELDDAAGRLSDMGLSDTEMTHIANTYEKITVCEDINAQVERDSHWNYRRHVKDGIYEGLLINLRIALTIGLSIVIGGGVVGGLRKTEMVEVRTEPNSGMRRTAITALRVLVAFAAVGASVGMLVGFLLWTIPQADTGWSQTTYDHVIATSVTTGLAIGLGLGVLFGGIDAVIKHGVLRAFLMRKGNIPLNYARVLDAASERILLRKVGGGYIFIHRYLLEYFASQETGKRKRKTQ
ncbi:MAG: NACHT domain-containing protein [Chloroflexota bacterium]